MKKILFVSILLCIIFDSCINRKNSFKIAGSFNGENIYVDDIDKNIDKKLYDVLFQVYLMRKASLDEIIDMKIIANESKKLNVPLNQFVDSIIYNNINQVELINFAKKLKYDVYGIPELNNSLKYIQINSKKGELLLLKKYKDYLYTKYVDSLKALYDIETYLNPPPLPTVNMKSIKAHYRGCLKSKVTIWELSDLECNVCKEVHPIYEKIYNKYKGRVRFAFSYYSGGITLSSIALKAASRQNKFWFMYDSLIELKEIPYPKKLVSVAKKIGVDTTQFLHDLKDSSIYDEILHNFKAINDQGFYGTPTIVINDKVILDAFSEKAIETAIEDELSRKE